MMRTSYDPEADAFYARFAPDGVGIVGIEGMGGGRGARSRGRPPSARTATRPEPKR